MNNTFYQLPEKKVFQKWKNETPEDFLFILKANRYITHMKKLKDPRKAVDNFINNAQGLGTKLGPILFQLPPNWKVNPDRLRDFVAVLPKKHRYAFEFRNKTWYCREIYQILKENNFSFCIHDHADAPSSEIETTDFVYLRFHGPFGAYSSKYGKKQLEEWAEKIANWQKNDKEIFAYFNNDIDGFAVQNAQTLKKLIKII